MSEQDQQGTNNYTQGVIGVCDTIAVPIPVRLAMQEAGWVLVEQIDFRLYSLVCLGSRLVPHSESAASHSDLIVDESVRENDRPALLVMLYTLSDCDPRITFHLRMDGVRFEVRDRAITCHLSSPPKALSAPSKESRLPAC